MDASVSDDNEDSEEFALPSWYDTVPLYALRVSSRRRIGMYLNLESSFVQVVSGLPYVNDFNGLAELIGFDYLDIKNFARMKSPTEELLTVWQTRPDLSPNVANLCRYLRQLGRHDVLTDCKSLIVKDVEVHRAQKTALENIINPIQDDSVSQSSDRTDHHIDPTVFMTKQDVEYGCPQYYDAYVCYTPNGDIQFVKQMISILEENYSLKLLVPGRDDLPGGAEYEMQAAMMEKRCRRVVIVMSQNYARSAACDFQTKFAQCLSPGARSKMLIPVLIDRSYSIPSFLRFVTVCDFTRSELTEWIWDRLASAIKAPLQLAPEIDSDEHQRSISSIKMNLSLEYSGAWSSSTSRSVSHSSGGLETSGESSLPSISGVEAGHTSSSVFSGSDMDDTSIDTS